MQQLLTSAQTVRTVFSGLACRVNHFLGGGGQGEVYHATLGGNDVALKWYFPHAVSDEQYRTLNQLVQLGPPHPAFLWPMDLAVAPEMAGCGYVMPLRPERYRSLVDLMMRRVEPSFAVLAQAGLQLANSFLQLHAKGWCYRDINFGNVFFDPDDGDVLICDNDNVSVDIEAPGGVLGTPRFMAPEVIRGEARPSTRTDLYSLAVLLFYMFMMHHPLEGERELAISCFDLPAMARLYGLEPVFIFDPLDRSNAPVPGEHDNALAFWPIYPQFIRDLFLQSFTRGLHDPVNGRVRESEWRRAMARLHDAILYCPQGDENFYCPDTFQAKPEAPLRCWACNRSIHLPPRIDIATHVIMLNHDTRLYPHHIDPRRLYDFSAPIAEVAPHPARSDVWGLRNVSAEKWSCTLADGTLRDVAPGQSVTLALGTRLHFGTAEGYIHSA